MPKVIEQQHIQDRIRRKLEYPFNVSLTDEEAAELFAVGGDAPEGAGNFQVNLMIEKVTNEGSENELWTVRYRAFLHNFEDYEEALEWLNCLEAEARSSLPQALWQ